MAVCRRILAEGRTPFLIVIDGVPASALYARLGFTPTEALRGVVVTRRQDGIE